MRQNPEPTRQTLACYFGKMKGALIKSVVRNLIVAICAIAINNASHAQNWSGLRAPKDMAEFEAQRYLMDELYAVTTEGIDLLRIKKVHNDVDWGEGFMFLITSYRLNENKGVVFTYLRETMVVNNQGNLNQAVGSISMFRNQHFTNEEFQKLNELIMKLADKDKKSCNDHYLVKFNNRLTVDFTWSCEHPQTFVSFWGDNKSRHSVLLSAWKTAYSKHMVLSR